MRLRGVFGVSVSVSVSGGFVVLWLCGWTFCVWGVFYLISFWHSVGFLFLFFLFFFCLLSSFLSLLQF